MSNKWFGLKNVIIIIIIIIIIIFIMISCYQDKFYLFFDAFIGVT